MNVMRKDWTNQQVETLMAKAAEFTAQGKRVRWGDIAPSTGHSEKSCANKYHQIRNRAGGLLASELIDADLAAAESIKRAPVKPRPPAWTAEEEARLVEACQNKSIVGLQGWEALAETSFPGRSAYAVRQRYLELRNKDAGIVRMRVRESEAKPQLRAPVKPEARPKPPPLVEYKTLTAAFFGDPRPGSSALDKRLAGIVEHLPPSNHREVYYASRPKITLAGETSR